MSGKDLIKLLKSNGWELDRVSGSHHILKKDSKTIVVPIHGNKDIKIGTLNTILKEAGLK